METAEAQTQALQSVVRMSFVDAVNEALKAIRAGEPSPPDQRGVPRVWSM